MTGEGAANEVVARASASLPRRGIGLGALTAMGLLLFWLALGRTGAHLLATVPLLVCGAGALWVAARMYQATRSSVELTRSGLRLSDGTVLAPMSEVVSVDRSAFAFKPSNGFLVRLAKKGEFGWAPGVWWRIGRSLAIGGVLPGGQTRAMADIIKIMLLERDQEKPSQEGRG